jgi:Protein of unknown function (DUF3631)/Domain of unknown function (DUF3854)
VLAEHHQALLVASAISPEVAEARGYFTAQGSKAELGRLGFGVAQRIIPALVIPQWNVLGECTHHMIRPDEPREVDGKARKYEMPAKAAQTLDVPPLARTMLEDPAIPLVITEGSRKADAAVSRGMCAISVNGVYGFRGTNDKGGKAALPDWEMVALNGRPVLLAFDSDALTKKPVHQALRRLRGLLEMRKAEVRIVVFPPEPSGRKVGLDDWLASDGRRGFVDLDALAVEQLPDVGPAEQADTFADVEDEPGWVVLEDVRSFLVRFVRFADDVYPVAVALWIAHTHALDAFDFTPRLHVRSAVKRSGKSRLLEVLERLAARALYAVNASPAALFRIAEESQPTILFDEVDHLLGGAVVDPERSDLVGLINSGFRRGGSVVRVVGQSTDMRVVRFSTYCPVALAGIGTIADTIADRAVAVPLERRQRGEEIDHFRFTDVDPRAAELRRRLQAWTIRHLDRLAVARPLMPDGIVDRAADTWSSLLAVADVAGGSWPELARHAAVAIDRAHQVDDDQSLGIRLLRDVYDTWPAGQPYRFSSEVTSTLLEVDEAPWTSMSGGRGLNANKLAGLLRDFGIRSKKVRIGVTVKQGYERDHFLAVWRRYGVADDEQQAPPFSPGEGEQEEHEEQEEPSGGVPDVPDVPDVPPPGGREGGPVDASLNGDQPEPLPGATRMFTRRSRS